MSNTILLRETAGIAPTPPPQPYKFLEETATTPLDKFRIKFRHPAYNADENLLFILYGFDYGGGVIGIHHGLAHNACAIIADNRFDGYLSKSNTDEPSDRISVGWDEVIPADVEDYYFYVPLLDSSSLEPQQTPYRWPIVTSFQDWKFPKNLPEVWKRCESVQGVRPKIASQSTYACAVQSRDSTCRVTAFESGTEAAHLIPQHERKWFESNNMAAYNSNQTLDQGNLLRDLQNAVLLRSDIHTVFDERTFVFFPKNGGPNPFVVHMLQPAVDVGQLYHNTTIHIHPCGLQFLFARFAWSIFPSLSAFLAKSLKSRLVVQVDADHIRSEVELSNIVVLARRAIASRSNSPTKRARVASNLEEEVEESSERPHCYSPDRNGFPPRMCSTLEAHRGFEENSPSSVRDENNRINEMRKKALMQQRPPGYHLPSYDRHRPAKEELFWMGVDVISDPYDSDEMDKMVEMDEMGRMVEMDRMAEMDEKNRMAEMDEMARMVETDEGGRMVEMDV